MSGESFLPLRRRLLKQVAKASSEHRLLEPDDRVLVAVSGGKDSLVLLDLLARIAKRAPFRFTLVVVHIGLTDPSSELVGFFGSHGYEYRVVREDPYALARRQTPMDQSCCSLCSRLRRGILYTAATQLGATKIALGHHREDLAETLLLNLFYSGQIKSMPARLQSDDRRHIVIRPLCYCAEQDIRAYAEASSLPVVAGSPCGPVADVNRQRMKRLIAELARENDHVPGNLLAALSNVRETHLLDRRWSGCAGSPAPITDRDPT